MKNIFSNFIIKTNIYLILKLMILFLIAFYILSSCSILNVNKIEQNSNITSNKNNIFIDVGKGKIGGEISFEINFSKNFKTQGNVNGWDAKYASIDHYKVALVTTAGTGSNSLTTLPSGTSSDVYSISKASLASPTASATHIFFKNVPDGTYYVAVSAYDISNRNMTKVITTTGTISVSSGDNFAVSTSGGDAINNGSVTVSSIFAVPSPPVAIPLTLKDSFGANIQSDSTATDGTTNIKSDINLIRFYLVNSKTTSNLVDANIIKGPFDITSGALFTSLKSGALTNLSFDSVPLGTYYVASAAFSSSTIVDSSTNITNLTKNTFANITITTSPAPTGNMGTFSISNSGGDAGAAPGPGRVVVASNYDVSSTSSLILPLKLKDLPPVIMSTLLKGFAILAGTTITNIGGTTVTGDMGLFAGTSIVGFDIPAGPGTVTGNTYAGITPADQAQIDLLDSISDASSRSAVINSISGDLGGLTLLPGLYK
jgi:hypothetical protein